jgi:ATP-dependent Lhr-like helicase
MEAMAWTEVFSDVTRKWFTSTFDAPTPVQRNGWPRLAKGGNALLVAPTGSGKTLAAFLWSIDRVFHLSLEDTPGVRVLYVSPLKALVYDIERNLQAPLAGIRKIADGSGRDVRPIGVDVRTGDTPSEERRRQVKTPSEILVTTPESLFLILGSQAAKTLRSVHTVIVDEIHAFAPTKRGVHLALSLERLETITENPPQRIGLSATVRPHDEAARFLVGDRDVAIVDASEPAHVDLSVLVPEIEEVGPPKVRRDSHTPIYPRLLEEIRAHRSTLVFVNSRGQAERMAQRLNELAGESLVQSHHGSLSHEKRGEIEESLKAGNLRGIVATSSLELGIDMGEIDLVVLVESPGSVVRGLQRVGRAGHKVGERSSGLIFPRFGGGDLLECAVVSRRMELGLLEPIHVPQNALDVLAQQVVALCCSHAWSVDDIHGLVRRAYPYRELSREALLSVLDMLSGRYPSGAFADLRPRLNWDRSRDVLTARRGTKMISNLNVGTIPDRGLYGVHLGAKGPRVGELDEEMVYESRTGETFLLGASTWRIESITRDRVIVAPAPGEPGKMPFWRGDGPGRPIELGRAIGAFVRKLGRMKPGEAAGWIQNETPLDGGAAQKLATYIHDQKQHTGSLPTDRTITIERFRDELGDWRICILTPFGSRVHAPWALALESALSENAGIAVQTLYSDDGIVLRFADVEDELPGSDQLIPDPDDVEDRLVSQVASSALFASAFRENAARSLLIPRRRPDRRAPLWQQRLKAKTLLAEIEKYSSFPVMLETYRQCLRDVFDLSALLELLHAIRRREVRVDDVETQTASPFSRALVSAYVAVYLYEQDAPLAERKAQALTLDRQLLRDLLGQAELRELIDADAIDEVEAELQGLAPSRKARHTDGLHDLLRRVGDLTEGEIGERVTEDASPWLRQLEDERRAVKLKIAGVERWVAAEDVARYRDALGVVPPAGLPESLLETVNAPLEDLLRRYARTQGPFVTEAPASRLGLPPVQIEPVLRELESAGRLVRGEIRPGGVELDWCDADVLRRLKRATLAKLRQEAAPVDSAVLGRFLPEWHELGEASGLEEAVARLEGLALPWSSISKSLLPERVASFRLDMLDMLAASGAVVWIGAGRLGANDGRVILFRRDRAALLLETPPPYAPPTSLHEKVLMHLDKRGASFTLELMRLDEDASLGELESALWDLVWAGQITNDTLLPLRNLGRRARPGRWRGQPKTLGGRWSLVRDLMDESRSPTERALARCQILLERYGIVSREAALADEIPGGFKAVYDVLKTMDENGRVRRGYFVEGLSATQFAYPGAVERLRTRRDKDSDASTRLLAAVDPANPYGSLLPWPQTSAETRRRPRRISGAWVILHGGRLAAYVHTGGMGLLSFEPMQDGEVVRAVGESLRGLASRYRRSLRLTRIDGEPATKSPFATVLKESGFRPNYNDLVAENW